MLQSVIVRQVRGFLRSRGGAQAAPIFTNWCRLTGAPWLSGREKVGAAWCSRIWGGPAHVLRTVPMCRMRLQCDRRDKPESSREHNGPERGQETTVIVSDLV